MTDVERWRDRARDAVAGGRIDEALAAFGSAAGAAAGLGPVDPLRIALASEHAEAWFVHRADAARALEIATPVYEEAVDAIDDAGEHRAAVRALADLRDRMTFWAFRLPD